MMHYPEIIVETAWSARLILPPETGPPGPTKAGLKLKKTGRTPA
jgi:hypothetical protein